MFSGIVSGLGSIKSIKDKNDIVCIEIKAPKNFGKKLQKGASVSVDGVCLTAKNSNSDIIKFDVIEETLKKTNLNNISTSSKVNLERSITAKTEIGGHLVSGHIHGTGQVQKVIDRKETKDLQIKIPVNLREYFFYKGYVALNGCSLTIGKVLKSSFYIHLIPETVSVTTFDQIKKGDLVNIEIEQATINTVETVKRVMLERKV